MGATADHDVEQLRARLNDYMAKHGLRSTEQRRLVTEMFFATTKGDIRSAQAKRSNCRSGAVMGMDKFGMLP